MGRKIEKPVSILIIVALVFLQGCNVIKKTPVEKQFRPSKIKIKEASVMSDKKERSFWWKIVKEKIKKSEYNVTWKKTDQKDIPSSYQAPNRFNNLRIYFLSSGIRIVPRTEKSSGWQLGMTLSGYGFADTIQPVHASRALAVSNNKVRYDGKLITEWYRNEEKSIIQGFTLNCPPESKMQVKKNGLALAIKISGMLVSKLKETGNEIIFINSEQTNILKLGGLHAIDASGHKLPARYMCKGNQIGIHIDTADGMQTDFPVTILQQISIIDRLFEEPAHFGYSAATAGDVNGDGYSDLILGADLYDHGFSNAGAVFVYHGSKQQLDTDPSWSTFGSMANEYFGHAVATAGDVNNDGISDVIIGARGYDRGMGAAYVYHGKKRRGLSIFPDWKAVGTQVGWGGVSPREQINKPNFGHAVATAGDVNGDGISDVIIGAPSYNRIVTEPCNNYPCRIKIKKNVGAAFVYYGSDENGLNRRYTPQNADWIITGDTENAYFGYSVSTAGDTNADGVMDVIVGSPYYTLEPMYHETGKIFLFKGIRGRERRRNDSGQASWTSHHTQSNALFGYAVSSAGDVNGDGMADIIAGAPYFDNDQQESDAGMVSVYFSPFTGRVRSWQCTGDQEGARLGISAAAAGDMNGDGYADVIAGAEKYDGEYPDSGGAFVFLGTRSVRPDTRNISVQSADLTVLGPNSGSLFGHTVATAGDVDGDGYAEIIIGSPAAGFDNDYGVPGAYLYHGGAVGLEGTLEGWRTSQFENYLKPVASAGDINGDGFSDIIIGTPKGNAYNNADNEGTVVIYHGSGTGLSGAPDKVITGNNPHGYLGLSLDSAGDVNGDGYDDIIIGGKKPVALTDYNGQVKIVYGSVNGLDAVKDFEYQGSQSINALGWSVGKAGDVNGDGYADVIIGDPFFNMSPGRVILCFGNSEGITSLVGSGCLDLNFSGQGFKGWSVSTADDINGDGYDDVIIGAPGHKSSIHIFSGSSENPGANEVWRKWEGTENDEYRWTNVKFLGQTVSSAGDIDGDGLSDTIARYEFGTAVVYGSSQEDIWIDENRIQRLNSTFGYDIRNPGHFNEIPPPVTMDCAGDLNGDGYADIIITGNDEIRVYHGSKEGPGETPDWTIGNENGCSFVSTAGDVNGDGYADLLISDFDSVRLFYGNGGPGVSLVPRQKNSTGNVPVAQGGMSDSNNSFMLSARGHNPFGWGRVKLQWEVKPLGSPFDGNVTGESQNWKDTYRRGLEIKETIDNLTPGTNYHWRMRLRFHPVDSPFQQYSRWFSVPNKGWSLKNIKTRD